MNLGFLNRLLDQPFIKYFATFCVGSLLTFCFAPFHYTILLLVCFQTLFDILEKSSTHKHILLSVFLFFFGFFSASLYWLYYSFKTVNLAIFGPFAVIGLAVLLSFITGIFFIFFPNNWEGVPKWRKKLCFASLLFAGEFLRGHIFTGFPWNLTGYSCNMNFLLQSCSVIGIYGLTFFTIIAAVFLFSGKWKVDAVFFTLGFIVLVWGGQRISAYKQQPIPKEQVFNLRLVQPSVAQTDKWNRQKFWNHLNRLLYLSRLPSERKLNAIIWPEAAITTYLSENPELIKIVTNNLDKDTYLITGSPRRENNNVYNSLFVLNHLGEILCFYDKSHLTPFGEYIPFPSITPFKKLTHGFSDFSSGKGLEVINLQNIPPFVPLICYEAIHPGYVIPSNKNIKPRWILNITNDAWFGKSIGPHQHLKIVLVRCIEEGLPMMRVANNGITAVINACGEVVQKIDTDDVGIIDEQVPLSFDYTFYGQYHKTIDVFFFVLTIILFLLSAGISNAFKKSFFAKIFRIFGSSYRKTH